MKTKNFAFGLLAIALIYGIVFSIVSPVRASDPDQYYHYSVAKHISQTLDIHTLPQVKGLGWNLNFANKEFLFHVIMATAYKIGGEPGMITVVFLLSLGILFLIYALAFEMTKEVVISAGVALLPLFADSFLLRLVIVRPHLLGMLIVFFMTLCLLKNWRWLVFASGLVFTLSYHAWYLPIFILIVWHLVQHFYKKPDRMMWMGLAGMFIGTLINPYFPSNYVYIATFLKIITDQWSNTGLDFGKEVEPFRSDSFLLFLRFFIAGLGAGVGVLFLYFKNSQFVIKQSEDFNRKYLFFGFTSFSLLLLTMITPRMEEYFVPIVCVYMAMTFFCMRFGREILAGFLALSLLSLFVIKPFGNLNSSIQSFQQFDKSYLELADKLPPTGLVLNCDWWGGHYVMYKRDQNQVIDVLDPSFLREADHAAFFIVENIRRGKVGDPYHFIKNVLKADHVLCGSNSPLTKLLLEDFRFAVKGMSHNYKEDLYLFEVPQSPYSYIASYEWQEGNAWAPAAFKELYQGSAYITARANDTCEILRPAHDELKKILEKKSFVFSGTGRLSLYKDGKLVLNEVPLPLNNSPKELIVPIEPGNWTFKLCPLAGSPGRLATHLISSAELLRLCPNPNGNGDGKPLPKATYAMSTNICDAITVKKAN